MRRRLQQTPNYYPANIKCSNFNDTNKGKSLPWIDDFMKCGQKSKSHYHQLINPLPSHQQLWVELQFSAILVHTPYATDLMLLLTISDKFSSVSSLTGSGARDGDNIGFAVAM